MTTSTRFIDALHDALDELRMAMTGWRVRLVTGDLLRSHRAAEST
jgi:hypothetical protein